MPAFGILFIVFGAFLLRQTIVGRAKDTPTDARDIANALLSGDTATVATVMARRGSNTGTGVGSESTAGSVDGSSSAGSTPVLSGFGSTALAAQCISLGTSAKGYRLGATGPDFYDCSGLVWRAAYSLGIYRGPRFTTGTFPKVANQFCSQIASPETGCIVNWVNHGHMGVMVSNTDFYSARSPAKGIGTAPLAADITYFGGEEPTYWRVNYAPSAPGGRVQN